MKPLRLLNLLAVLLTIAFNGLANALPLFGRNTGSISDQFPVLFTPAGYVFSIWGIIYLALLAFGIYQVLPSQRDNPHLERIGIWFILSCVFNCVWLTLWHSLNIALSTLAIIGLFISLLMIYLRLGIGIKKARALDSWLVNLPFSIYLGWSTVATIANISITLYALGWNGFMLTPQLWTVIVILTGAVIAIMITLRRHEVAFPLVIIWAFAGIWVKQNLTAPIVSTTALASAGVILTVLVLRLLLRKTAR